MLAVDYESGEQPRFTGTDVVSYYMRSQGRSITCFELQALARGGDLRPAVTEWVSVGKLFLTHVRDAIVRPDRMYKMQCLKDTAKHNKCGRNELIGTTRHKDPLLCCINAMATTMLLRFGKDGRRAASRLLRRIQRLA